MPAEFEQLRAALRVPHARRAVVAGGQDAPPVGAEDRITDEIRVTGKGDQFPACFGIPDFWQVAVCDREQTRPIRAECDAQLRVDLTRSLNLRAHERIEHPDRPVGEDDRQLPAVRAVGGKVTVQFQRAFACRRRPRFSPFHPRRRRRGVSRPG
jgi:hypothetical protein